MFTAVGIGGLIGSGTFPLSSLCLFASWSDIDVEAKPLDNRIRVLLVLFQLCCMPSGDRSELLEHTIPNKEARVLQLISVVFISHWGSCSVSTRPG
ncbi:hypothetical protein DFJ58DRAFT_818384 [Suillus subalutaceus]|uniref:uncharacterized protein n=1 Tax=Suillus subalutaceus TaxID=48586 RepID=UPI001B882BA4|nr:uncharacterized protein DFJ58DRAFT_818384 [Suillus subalutaceus]KAG1836445.1 hypothetical protein DFJ58DRAFT_818384 [Suillus subalutaceus]